MKTYVLASLSLFTMTCFSARAQVRAVQTDLQGRCRITVQVGPRRFVTVDPSGNFGRMEWPGRREYYDSFSNRCKEGKTKRIGDVAFDYYDSFDDRVKQGRIARIGDIAFDYYDTFDSDDKCGKLKRIGDMTVDYYDRFDNAAKRGKIARIGSVVFDYYDTFAADAETGRLSRIGDEAFEYDSFGGSGRPVSGNPSFEQDGIRFRVHWR